MYDDMVVNPINDLNDLKNRIKIAQTCSVNEALQYMFKAQLAVLDSIFTRNAMLSLVDLLFQNLKHVIDNTTNPQELDSFKEKAALMLYSMVSFAEAQVHYDKNKWDAEGIALLKEGCAKVAYISAHLLLAVVTSGASSAVSAGASTASKVASAGASVASKAALAKTLEVTLKENLFNDITRKQNKEFFNRFVTFMRKRNEKKETLLQFIHGLIQKLDRYTDMFGHSIILAEIVERYKDELIGRECKKLKLNVCTKVELAIKAMKEAPIEPILESVHKKHTYGTFIAITILFAVLFYTIEPYVALDTIITLLSLGLAVCVGILIYLYVSDDRIRKRNAQLMLNYQRELEEYNEYIKNHKHSDKILITNEIKRIKDFYDNLSSRLRA
jgi:hypothetical protein